MPLFRNDNSYRRRTALLSSGGVVSSIGLALLIVLIFTLHTFAPGFLVRMGQPFWKVGSAFSSGLRVGWSLFGNAAELTRERDALAAENLALHEQNRTIVARVTDLEALIGNAPAGESRILAGVLARPPVAPYDTLIVAAGSLNGVREGALVYGPGGVPLGTVAGVATDSSHIALYSTGGRITEGWVGEKRIPITLTGRSGGAFDATLPRGSAIAVNDVVYVPGPGALPLGTVVRIDSNPSSPRDIVHIAPYANLFSLTWIEIARH